MKAMRETPAAASTDAAPKRERLDLRVNREQKALMQRAAALEGTSLSDFVIRSVQRAAEQAIREHQIITLSACDSLALAEALLDPPAAGADARAAAARYQELVEES